MSNREKNEKPVGLDYTVFEGKPALWLNGSGRYQLGLLDLKGINKAKQEGIDVLSACVSR